jgi:GT2 family glycosyltransferase
VNSEQIFLQDLLIVIVVFEKNPSDTEAFKSLNSIRKGAMLVLYDNSPFPHPCSEIENAIYYHDPSNSGVSKAYNVAGKLAKVNNKKWLLLADQDTVFPDLLLQKYLHAISYYTSLKVFGPSLFDHVGLVSPFSFNRGKGNRIEFLKSGVYEIVKFRFANSGLLISLEAFEAAGGYDERFPLDYSDIVFADRLSKSYTEFVLVDEQCYHAFSGSEKNSDLRTIARFNTFCLAACLYKKLNPMKVPLYWVLLPRAIKLSLQTGNIQFLKLAWKSLSVA